MKVLVVGAAGKTGRAVAEQAVKRGHEVAALKQTDNGYDVAGVAVRSATQATSRRRNPQSSARTPSSTPSTGKPSTGERRLRRRYRRRSSQRCSATESGGWLRLVNGRRDSTANTPSPPILRWRPFSAAPPDMAGMETAVRSSQLDCVITRPAVRNDKPSNGDVRVFALPNPPTRAFLSHASTAPRVSSLQLTRDDNLHEAVTIANR